MNSSKGICFGFCITLSLIAGVLCISEIGPLKCERESHCSCTMTDKSGRYDLSSLSGTSTKPYFDHFPGRNASESFAFDPCVPFSILDSVSGKKTACENVAGCQVDASSAQRKTSYINIAKHLTVEFHYIPITQQMVLKYTNDDIFHTVVTEVHLHCLTPSEPTIIELLKVASGAVAFKLRSPNVCLITAPKGGLSTGSILCIIFSLSFIVYFVGGTLVLVFVQNKPFTEAIPPNKDFWLDLPDLIKDGAKFAMNGFKAAPPTHQRLGREEDDDNVYRDETNDDDEDDELKIEPGGGSSKPSDGFTAVPV